MNGYTCSKCKNVIEDCDCEWQDHPHKPATAPTGTRDGLMCAAFEAARNSSPAGQRLRRVERQLRDERERPAYLRRSSRRSVRLEGLRQSLDDLADRQAARSVMVAWADA